MVYFASIKDVLSKQVDLQGSLALINRERKHLFADIPQHTESPFCLRKHPASNPDCATAMISHTSHIFVTGVNKGKVTQVNGRIAFSNLAVVHILSTPTRPAARKWLVSSG